MLSRRSPEGPVITRLRKRTTRVKGARVLASHQRERLDEEHLDDIISDGGDTLSRRIVQAAKRKGIDPAKHGVIAPIRRPKDLAKRTKSYQEKLRILDLIDEGETMVESLEYNSKNLRYASVIGLGVFILIAASSAPLWSVLVGSVAVFGSVRLLKVVK